MRNLLASVATISLLTAGAALAQQAQPPGQGPGTMQSQPGQGTGNTMPGQAQTGAPSVSTAAWQEYRSYNEMDEFDGEIAGDHDADDLKDQTVVNRDGDEIGTIEDLAVGADDEVRQVVVDVSDFLDEDDRYVVIELDTLERGEGDADDDEFVLNKSKDELRGMTAYEKDGERWAPKSSGNL